MSQKPEDSPEKVSNGFFKKGLSRLSSMKFDSSKNVNQDDGDAHEDKVDNGSSPKSGFISRRLSAVSSKFDRNKNAHDEDDGSDTASNIAPERGPGFLSRKLNAVTHMSLSDIGGIKLEDIDDMLLGLHGDPLLLEKRCALQAKGENSFIFDTEEEVLQKKERARRVQARNKAKRSFDEVVNGLSDGFFSEDYDPVPGQLAVTNSWDWTQDEENISNLFMSVIESREIDRGVVATELNSLIQKNYCELMTCMKDVNAIDNNLERTCFIVTNGREKLRGAKKMMQGEVNVLDIARRKEKLLEVQQTMQSLKSLTELSQSMRDSIVMDDYSYAAQCACHVLDTLKNEVYSRFTCIKNISIGVLNMLPTIKTKVDKALGRLCSRKFVAEEYEQIIRTYVLLDYMADSMGANGVSNNEGTGGGSPGSGGTSSYDDCLGALANRVQECQLEDIESCLHTAVLEYVYASQHKKQLAVKELESDGVISVGSSAPSTMDIFDLTDCSINVLYSKLTPDMIAPCVNRSCEFLMDVIHTHYCITQWHLMPFEPRNSDSAHLHRSRINLCCDSDDSDDSDSEEEVVVTTDGDEVNMENCNKTEAVTGIKAGNVVMNADNNEMLPKMMKISSGSTASSVQFPGNMQEQLMRMVAATTETLGTSGPPSPIKDITDGVNHEEAVEGLHRLERLCKAKFVVSYQSMVANRPTLWDQVLNATVTMLNNIQLTAALSLEDFLSISATIELMIRLGKEFCGSDSVQLVELLREKSTEYFTYLHQESFTMFRLMVDAELWNNVPIALTDVGGILGLIRMNIERNQTLLSESELNLSANPGDSILMSFYEHGNPLNNLPAPGPNETGTEKAKGVEVLPGGAKGDIKRTMTMDFWNSILTDNEEDATSEKKKRANQAKMQSYVITQCVLNGLAKYCGTYMHVMHRVPVIAIVAYHGLKEMLEFYVATVFFGFVPDEERTKLLQKSTKMTAPCPDQLRTFEELQNCMERVMGSVVQTVTKKAVPNNGKGGEMPDNDDGTAPLSNVVVTTKRLADMLRQPAVIEQLSNSDHEENCCNMYALNERIVAAESCYFASEIINELKPKMMMFLPDSYQTLFSNFVSEFQLITGQLTSLVYKTMCPAMLNSAEVLKQILDCNWDSKNISDSHAWVENLVGNAERVSDAWCLLSI